MKLKKPTKTTTLALIAIAAIAGTVGVTWAISQWTQQFDWGSGADTTFTVWTAATGGEPVNLTLDLGDIPPDPTILQYYIQNDGDVTIRVTGSVTFTQGGATVTWSPSVGYVDVPVGTTRELIILTLTVFTGETGSGSVTFTSEEAPTT